MTSAVATTKVFMNGGSTAVRLPRAFSFLPGQKVSVKKRGEKVVIEPVEEEDQWAPLKRAIMDGDGFDIDLDAVEEDWPDHPRLPFDYDEEIYEKYRKGEKWW